MCTYNIILDDQLVAEAENTLQGITMEVWLQQQVESLLKEQVSYADKIRKYGILPSKVRKVKHRSEYAPSDEQLEARFAGLNMPSQPEDASWEEIINSNIGKTIKPVEKWL